MSRIWQGWRISICLASLTTLLLGEENKTAFMFDEPVVGAGIFTAQLGLLAQEREDYAHNLAIYTAHAVNEQKASPASLEQARRFLALSLHLAPRNRKAVVLNFQLKRGIMPNLEEKKYSSKVFASLLLTRGETLLNSTNQEDVTLGRCFSQVAAEIDPSNEDAVYASELLRIDKKQVNWSELTDNKTQPKP